MRSPLTNSPCSMRTRSRVPPFGGRQTFHRGEQLDPRRGHRRCGSIELIAGRERASQHRFDVGGGEIQVVPTSPADRRTVRSSPRAVRPACHRGSISRRTPSRAVRARARRRAVAAGIILYLERDRKPDHAPPDRRGVASGSCDARSAAVSAVSHRLNRRHAVRIGFVGEASERPRSLRCDPASAVIRRLARTSAYSSSRPLVVPSGSSAVAAERRIRIAIANAECAKARPCSGRYRGRSTPRV